jgi:hypothetical protein
MPLPQPEPPAGIVVLDLRIESRQQRGTVIPDLESSTDTLLIGVSQR